MNHRRPEDEENCPICMCELYDNIQSLTETQIQELTHKQMTQQLPIEVVKMSKCLAEHCFHKECLERQLNGQNSLRCASC